MKYQMDHVVFDEFGILTVHCICCHCVIRRRVEVPSRQDPSRFVYSVVTLSNYREIEVNLSDGSKMYPMFCAECILGPIDEKATMDVIRRGWCKEMRHCRRPESAIERFQKEKEGIIILKDKEMSSHAGNLQ